MNSDIQILLQEKAKGNISMNQAYKGWSNAGGNGTFKDFLSNATQQGWIDQGLNATSAFLHTKYDDGGVGKVLIADTPCSEGFEKDVNGICQPVKSGMSTIAMVGIGVAIIGVVAGIIYVSKQNNK